MTSSAVVLVLEAFTVWGWLKEGGQKHVGWAVGNGRPRKAVKRMAQEVIVWSQCDTVVQGDRDVPWMSQAVPTWWEHLQK